MSAIDANGASRPQTDWPRLVGALFIAPLAPGFLLGLLYPPILPLTLLGSLIVGAPFVYLIFLPTIIVLGRFWRMTWWSTALAGFVSVFTVAILHCVVTNDLHNGFERDLFLAGCSGVAALFFWSIVGDFGGAAATPRDQSDHKTV